MPAAEPGAALPDADRDAILEATLDHVAFEGWTPKAVAGGLADLGLPPAAGDLAFPGGMAEMIRYWAASLDARMTEQLGRAAATDAAGADAAGDDAAGADATAAGGARAVALPERIRHAIRLRLALCEPHREAVRRAIAYLSLPPNQPTLVRMTYDTADAVWYAVGDRSTDFSFYTKRASLAGIYAATVLFWLDDTSDDSEATAAFLARRLAEFGRLHGMRRRAERLAGGLLRPLAAFRPPFGRAAGGG
jgi:ubiquinone biosynthesis protein COQ9